MSGDTVKVPPRCGRNQTHNKEEVCLQERGPPSKKGSATRCSGLRPRNGTNNQNWTQNVLRVATALFSGHLKSERLCFCVLDVSPYHETGGFTVTSSWIRISWGWPIIVEFHMLRSRWCHCGLDRRSSIRLGLGPSSGSGAIQYWVCAKSQTLRIRLGITLAGQSSYLRLHLQFLGTLLGYFSRLPRRRRQKGMCRFFGDCHFWIHSLIVRNLRFAVGILLSHIPDGEKKRFLVPRCPVLVMRILESSSDGVW